MVGEGQAARRVRGPRTAEEGQETKERQRSLVPLSIQFSLTGSDEGRARKLNGVRTDYEVLHTKYFKGRAQSYVCTCTLCTYPSLLEAIPR